MGAVYGIPVLILTVINWIIYHKIFNVWYFGNVGNSIFKEFFWSMIVAGVEVVIFINFASFIIPIILGIVIIIGIIIGILAMVGNFADIKSKFSPKQK